MYENINGIKIFYQKFGSGRPLIMLHGNGESHKIFNNLASKLETSFAVFLPDSRGHGQSDYAPLDYFLMAEDVFTFINKLKIEEPIIFGFSDGGIISLLLAAHHPDCIAGLIAAGANLSPASFKWHIKAGMKLEYLLHKKEETKLMLTQPEISEELLKQITVPSLILAGEKDIFVPSHTRKIARLIPNSELIILKGHNHYDYVCHSDLLAWIIEDFCKSLV